MAAKADYLEQKILDYIFNDQAFAAPQTFIALFTVAPADDGTGGTEVSGGAYARQEVAENGGVSPTWDLAVTDAGSGGYLVDSTHAITFPQASAAWGLVKAFGIYDAVTVGNLLYHGDLGDNPNIFIGTSADDRINAIAHGYSDDDKVVFKATHGSLPTGISPATELYVISSTTDDFQVSLTEGGGAITITADGNGTVFFSRYKQIDIDDTFEFAIGDLDVIEK